MHSLNLLRNFPVSAIKIDKSFIQVMQSSPKDQAIVLSLIDLARQLGLKVVAEGMKAPNGSAEAGAVAAPSYLTVGRKITPDFPGREKFPGADPRPHVLFRGLVRLLGVRRRRAEVWAAAGCSTPRAARR